MRFRGALLALVITSGAAAGCSDGSISGDEDAGAPTTDAAIHDAHPFADAQPSAADASQNDDALPSTADAQPSNADAQPSNADAQPSNADAQPSNADAQPSNADAQPSNADAQPSNADAQSTNADAQPTNADAQPTNADAQPANADAQPANADAQASNPDAQASNPDAQSSNPDAQPNGDAGPSPILGGCPVLPSDHIFNTPINGLPVHPNSGAFMNTIGTTRHFHLDLGSDTDQTSPTYYGIPYNIVHGATIPWVDARFYSADTSLNWNARAEADCAAGVAHTLVSPCLVGPAPNPIFPIPAAPWVEGGIDSDPTQPYGDHHILMLDADSCRLWELYHAYPDATSGWDIYGAATFDLQSNALRPAGWTSADAAGFPMLPLLLRADEASSGEIRHALRITIQSSKIRTSYVWPARHLTGNGTASLNLPPMGQLFRVRSSYVIPANFNAQARAILQAMKTYGMYIADGGSDMYVTGEPSAAWLDQTISQVQMVGNADVEAVDLSPIMNRAGFDPNSGAVPP